MSNLLAGLLETLLDGSTQVWVDLGEVSNNSVLDRNVSSRSVGDNIVGQVLLLVWVSTQHMPQVSSLLELGVGSLPLERTSGSLPNFLVLLKRELLGGSKVVGWGEVVWSASQVTVDLHGTVSDVRVESTITRSTSDRTVDRDLVVVSTQSVSVSVWV